MKHVVIYFVRPEIGSYCCCQNVRLTQKRFVPDSDSICPKKKNQFLLTNTIFYSMMICVILRCRRMTTTVQSCFFVLTDILLHFLPAGSIQSSCNLTPPKCVVDSPCMNEGTCHEGWNRYICDCTQTSFAGPTCGKGTCIYV